jgi:pimeloyl-ACP methyl ester carboxylesterase
MRSRLLAVLFAFALAAPALHAQPARPPQPELRYVEIPAAARAQFAGDRFSYQEAGPAAAPVVMLLHGIGANSFFWRHQYPALGERYRVIAWNAPGYILTDPLRKERPTCDDYVDAFAAFADAMRVPRFALVGNSFGSAIAQCFALRHPQRVERMALSGVSVGARSTPAAEREATFQRRQKQFEAAGGMTYANSVIGLLVGSRTPPAAREEILEVLRATNGRGYLQASFVPYELDSLAFAGKLALPVLIYQGTEDKISPLERTAVALEKALPDARLVRFEGYGHLLEVEAPERVNALLLEFLGKR